MSLLQKQKDKRKEQGECHRQTETGLLKESERLVCVCVTRYLASTQSNSLIWNGTNSFGVLQNEKCHGNVMESKRELAVHQRLLN